MSESVKEQLTADLQKVKSVGGERIDRIRKIFQEALNQTVSELREGSTEVQSIAKDSNLAEMLKKPATSEAAPEVHPLAVTIEDASEHISAPDDSATTAITDDMIVDAIVEAIVESEHSAKPPVAIVDIPVGGTAVVDAPVTPATVPATDAIGSELEAETTVENPESTQSANPGANSMPESLQSLLNRITARWNDEQMQAKVKPILIKLEQLLATADSKLATRYGERYDAFKQEFHQDMEKTKVWYNDTKADAIKKGEFWTDRKQAEVDVKAGEAGATIAQKEQKIKQLLKELWQTVTKG